MNCTTAVFTLMSGTALLSLATLYTYNRNILGDFKQKMSNLNVALSSLQIERSELINKSNDMYVETATKSVMADQYKGELESLKETVARLQFDNELLKTENNKEEISLLQLTINRLQFDKQVLESENNVKVTSLTEKINHLEQENESLKTENSKEDLASLLEKINLLEIENKRLKIDSNHEEFVLLKETVNRLQNDNELLITAYQQLEKRI
jgi:predicted  nucleic acid-binding Zn ribbon protein